MKCEIEGVKYKSRAVELRNMCEGCAGMADDAVCKKLHLQGCDGIIWVKVKPRMKVDGVTYKAVKEVDGDTCEGCVTAVFSDLCDALCPDNECYEQNIIWVEKVEKVEKVKRMKTVEPTPAKTVVWVNIYGDGIPCFHYETEQAANVRAEHDRLACVKIEY